MYTSVLRHLFPSESTANLNSAWQHVQDKMTRFNWAQAVLALGSYAAAQDASLSPSADGLASTAYASATTGSVATPTVSGATSTFSIPFTVPVSADVGPNVLPNVKDPNSKQAQSLCPGYTASNVEYTEYGFTAVLNLAGEAVSRDNCTQVSRLTGLVQCIRD